jgi:hypothetical protein
MNYVAAIAAGSPSLVLAFILMSNHVHFLLLGTKTDAEAFINEFKRRYSKYFQNKYGVIKILKQNKVDVKLVPFEEEKPERAIAYVLMNSVAANICLQPTQYSWGTGDLFFNPNPPKGIRVDSLSERKRFQLLHTKTDLPGHWLIGEDTLPSFKDQTLLSILPELCQKLFGNSFFKELSDPQRAEVLRQLRYRFSSNIHQLARIAGLTYNEAAKLMDSE